MSALDQLLTRLPRWTLVGGKGGVGKTTCAAAFGVRSAARGARTLLLSTDPARTLGEAIGVTLEHRPRAVPDADGLHAAQLDAAAAREAFLGRWREVLVTIIDRGTYLDLDDIAGVVDSALPGADEAMALLTLAELASEDWERIVVDTAPTGHTLRLLSLPTMFAALVDLLDAMQEKHRFMVSALTHRYRRDEADRFLDEMRRQIEALRATLGSGRRAALVLVTRPEPVVVAETRRFADALPGLGMGAGGLVVNAIPPAPSDEERAALGQLRSLLPEAPHLGVPLLEELPSGIEGVRRWAEAVHDLTAPPGGPPQQHDDAETSTGRHRFLADATTVPPAELPVRPLTIVGGKGGVGKTTVACALAVAAADDGATVLLVSTDPAPSVADALAQPIGDDEHLVDGAPRLIARQMDAAAAFDRFRTRYAERIDAMFDAVLGRAVDATHDRRIMRELLALTPPGIDELYALATLGETIAEHRFGCVVVDPAPTGHLLRLLEMPALGLEWSHRLMRILLKYREVGSLGDAAQELLDFARRTRALGAMLRDAQAAGMIVVALDEPLVRGETRRLIGAARERGVDVAALLWNRVADLPSPLSAEVACPQFVAPRVDPPPRGVDALRRWRATWRLLPERDA